LNRRLRRAKIQAGSIHVFRGRSAPIMSQSSKAFALTVGLLFAVLAGLWATHAAAPPAVAKADVKKHAPAPREKRVRLSDTTYRNKLTQTIDFGGLDDPRTTLIEALDQLAKIHRVTFDINEQAFKDEMLNDVLKTEVAQPNAIPPMKTTLGTVLKKILVRVPAQSAAAFLIRKDYIEITTEAAVRKELNLPIPKLDDQKVNALPLTPIVWEEFRDEPLDDALQQIADAMDATILLDPRVKEKTGTKIDATLRNVTLDAAVELLADMASLAVVKRGGAYYVTSPENAERLRKFKP